VRCAPLGAHPRVVRPLGTFDLKAVGGFGLLDDGSGSGYQADAKLGSLVGADVLDENDARQALESAADWSTSGADAYPGSESSATSPMDSSSGL
jgi:hypothetical protein